MFQAERNWPLKKSFFATAFRYQYCLSRTEEDIFSFSHVQVGNWHLHTGNALPRYPLMDQAGTQIGYVLGVAVDEEKLITEDNSTLPISASSSSFWDDWERYLVNVAGRYAFIIWHNGATRLYCDPAGMIGVVYNSEDKYVAASLLLALKRPVRPNPLFDFDLIRDEGGKLSLFHTADDTVKRLNPNYFLDLDTFETKRFWPKDEVFAVADNMYDRTYEEIISRLSFNIEKIADRHPVSMPITGGQDSRILLGAARNFLGKIDQIYTHINNWSTWRDSQVAAALTELYGRQLEVHDRENHNPKKWELNKVQRAFNITFGVEATAPTEYLNGVVNDLIDGSVVLRGHHTDILRAVYVFQEKSQWKNFGWQIKRLLITPFKKFDSHVVRKFTPDFARWQKTLPDNAMEKAADFMFLEIYYNSTVGATFPALWRNFYMSPFSSRKLISLSLSFDDSYRRRSFSVFDIIRKMDPKLEELPFDFEYKAEEFLKDKEAGTLSNLTQERTSETEIRLKRA